MTLTPPVDADTGEVRVRPLADTLRDLGRGRVIDEAAVLLQDVVRAVKDSGKKGRLTITVDVAPMKGNDAALLVSANATAKLPPSEPIAGAFFPDVDGNLLRDDPRQPMLPLRELNGVAAGEVKDLRQA